MLPNNDPAHRFNTPTNYEIGNDILHSLCDRMLELENECGEKHPEVAMVLRKTRLSYGPLVNSMMDEALAPTPNTEGKIQMGLQGLINRARKRYENYNRWKQAVKDAGFGANKLRSRKDGN